MNRMITLVWKLLMKSLLSVVQASLDETKNSSYGL